MSTYLPFGASGHHASWTTWDGAHSEALTIAWENEGWTLCGAVGREDVQYVLRLSPAWQVRQFLLFRDLDEPDLWLATDGSARWGEMNGAHRVELDGCYDVALDITPVTHSLPIRRLPVEVGDAAELPVAHVDVETLEVRRQVRRYVRRDTHRWTHVDPATGGEVDLVVDAHGLVTDVVDRYRRAE